jgi:hypothetical protein
MPALDTHMRSNGYGTLTERYTVVDTLHKLQGHLDNHERVKSATEEEREQRQQRQQHENKGEEEDENKGEEEEEEEPPFVLDQDTADMIAEYRREWSMTPAQDIILCQIEMGTKLMSES